MLSPNQYNTYQQQNARRNMNQNQFNSDSIGQRMLMNSSQVEQRVPDIVDLEDMQCEVVSKIQSLRKIAYNLEIKIQEQEKLMNKDTNP